MLRALRATLSIALALCVLGAGVWAGGGFSRAQAATSGRPPRATDEGPAYPARAGGEIPVGDALVVNGQPMQLSLFVTDDGPAKVVEYYRSAFAARGLIPIATATEQLGHVSVFDPEDGLQRFITAVPQPDGQTMVMLGVTNPRRAPRFTRAAQSMGLPVPDDQRGFLGYEASDLGTRSANGQFVTRQSVPAALAWYRAALAAQGYAESEAERAEGLATFRKDAATVTVAAQALEDKSGAMVFVNRVEGGAR